MDTESTNFSEAIAEPVSKSLLIAMLVMYTLVKRGRELDIRWCCQTALRDTLGLTNLWNDGWVYRSNICWEIACVGRLDPSCDKADVEGPNSHAVVVLGLIVTAEL